MTGDMKRQEKEMLAFNMAADYANTLSEGLKRTEMLWRNGNLPGAMWQLNSVWNTASPFLSVEENDSLDSSFVSMQKILLVYKKILRFNVLFQKTNRNLRSKLNDRGLLIPTSQDPRFIFGKSN